VRQQGSVDPTRPADPASGRDASAPAVLDKTAIPELGIERKTDDVAADPGLMPGLRTQAPLPVGEPATPEGRSTQFVPVEGGADTTSAEALLVTAYIVMWALLLGFVFFTWRRQQRLERRVGELERRPPA
jgi:CcmD family protein